jgi:hypothetical protein
MHNPEGPLKLPSSKNVQWSGNDYGGNDVSRADFVQFEPVRQQFASTWPTFFRYYRASLKNIAPPKELTDHDRR